VGAARPAEEPAAGAARDGPVGGELAAGDYVRQAVDGGAERGAGAVFCQLAALRQLAGGVAVAEQEDGL
jgi:hypothetical protein